MRNRNDDSSLADSFSVKPRLANQSPRSQLPINTCSIISLGCPKNLVDSESMIGALISRGFRFLPEVRNVELVILNTCGFLQSSRNEALDCIKELLTLKKKGLIRYLVVTGCLIQVADRQSLLTEFGAVDAWLGPFNENELNEVVDRLRNGQTSRQGTKSTTATDTTARASNELPVFLSTPQKQLSFFDDSRSLLTLPHVAYIKIAEGCDRFCSYCLIPSIRGRFISKSKIAILEEAKRLAAGGVRELVLIAQETTFWGSDLGHSQRLADLLFALRELGLFDWIRVLYSYPVGFDDELLSVLGSESPKADGCGTSKILPYVDLPLQHCNEDILKRMNRQLGKSETEELLARIREHVPEVVLRTSIIAGFPGETDAMFAELVEFLDKWRFERAGIFAFSPEQGTPAADMPNQVPERIRIQRCKRLYAKQERWSHGFARKLVGRTLPVLVDRQGTDSTDRLIDDLYLGRTAADAPDVDPLVYITGTDLVPGSFVDCEMVDVSGLDLIAVPVTDREG